MKTKQILLIALALVAPASLLPQTAAADQIDFRKVVRPKDPFKDLPGVKAPIDNDDRYNADCTTHIRRLQWGDPPRGRMPVRIYRCEDGPVTFESTRPPMQYDWRVYKKRRGD